MKLSDILIVCGSILEVFLIFFLNSHQYSITFWKTTLNYILKLSQWALRHILCFWFISTVPRAADKSLLFLKLLRQFLQRSNKWTFGGNYKLRKDIIVSHLCGPLCFQKAFHSATSMALPVGFDGVLFCLVTCKKEAVDSVSRTSILALRWAFTEPSLTLQKGPLWVQDFFFPFKENKLLNLLF